MNLFCAAAVTSFNTGSADFIYSFYFFILSGELDLNKRNCGGWTPLMYASYIGHDTIVHLLLEAGVSVNIPTLDGQTPLMLASSCGNESVAYFLLQVGVWEWLGKAAVAKLKCTRSGILQLF